MPSDAACSACEVFSRTGHWTDRDSAPYSSEHTAVRKRVSLFFRRRANKASAVPRATQSSMFDPSCQEEKYHVIVSPLSMSSERPEISGRSAQLSSTHRGCTWRSENEKFSFSGQNSAKHSETYAVESQRSNAEVVAVEPDNGTSEPNEFYHREGDIVGEICLEDFADEDMDNDYAFLDEQSGNLSSGALEMRASFCRLAGPQGAYVDNSSTVRWIGDEKEFAAFFAEVGLDDLSDVKEVDVSEFILEERMVQEWRASGEEHNELCSAWCASHGDNAMDIRKFVDDFERTKTCREVASDGSCGWSD